MNIEMKFEDEAAGLPLRPKRKPKPMTELQHQFRLMTWIERTAAMQRDSDLAEDLRWIHAVANGTNRSPIQRKIAEMEGVKRGVFDLCVPASRQGYHGMRIEMKRSDGRPSPEQLQFEAYCARRNVRVMYCYRWIDAARAIVAYFDLKVYESIPDCTTEEVLLQRWKAAQEERKQKAQEARQAKKAKEKAKKQRARAAAAKKRAAQPAA